MLLARGVVARAYLGASLRSPVFLEHPKSQDQSSFYLNLFYVPVLECVLSLGGVMAILDSVR